MFCKSRLVVILALALIPLAGCGAESPVPPASGDLTPSQTTEPLALSPAPSTGSKAPQPSSVQLLHDIVTNSDKYAGRQVTTDGVLEAEGQMPRVRFFLRDGNDRVEVSSWAPIETIQPPQGETRVKSMVYYAGRRLRLTGILEKGDEGLLLQVSVAEELQ